MGYFCKVHKGSWASTDIVVWHFPTNIELMNGSGYKQHQTVNQLSADFPDSFDPTWTILASDEEYPYLVELGFTDILRCNENLLNEKFYVSEHNYIEFYSTVEGSKPNNFSYVDSEGVIVETAITARTFYSKFQTDGNIRVGRIESFIGNQDFAYGIYPQADSDDRILHFLDGAEGIGDDPYQQGGFSGTGGGQGTFSGTGDAIAIPALPTLSATDAGFITLFNPTASQMVQLANYMWTNPLFDLENWRKIFANPMDAILGLSIVPVNVPSSGSREVKVGNISTGVSMTVASSQYVEVDCGTLNVQEFWGAYLDYEPYTTAEIYLPYCGTHAIKVDDIMGKSVHVVYHVDVLSGGCCCYVQCGGTVLYTFLGHCSVSIPVTGDNWTRVVNGAIQIAGSVGTMVATGGASFGTGVPNIASAAANLVKPAVEKSGAMGGPGGILAVQTPYLILTRPRQALPAEQNTFTGYPSFITETLGSLTGYTKVFSVHLEGIPATDSEITEIENLLKGGVIF